MTVEEWLAAKYMSAAMMAIALAAVGCADDPPPLGPCAGRIPHLDVPSMVSVVEGQSTTLKIALYGECPVAGSFRFSPSPVPPDLTNRLTADPSMFDLTVELPSQTTVITATPDSNAERESHTLTLYVYGAESATTFQTVPVYITEP